MTAQAVAGPRVRDLAPGEPRQLGELLDAAFSGYRDTTRFAAPVLDFLDGWAWSEHPLSVGIETRDGLVAAGLGTLRRARWAGRDLTAMHLGPIGVRPGHRRRGLGGHMLQALEARGRAVGADVLTLTTEVVYGAWRLYGRHGFRIVETYRPIVRPLFPGLPDTPGEVPPDPVQDLDSAAFTAAFRQEPGRPDAVVETWERAPEPPRVLRPRFFRSGDAAVATLRWPVLSRAVEGRVQVWATQIVASCGRGPAHTAALVAATRRAREDNAVCIYALPAVSDELPGFSNRGAPLVHRMARPLTHWGETVTAQARAWDEVCPAP